MKQHFQVFLGLDKIWLWLQYPLVVKSSTNGILCHVKIALLAVGVVR
jgi:hypothetical protein